MLYNDDEGEEEEDCLGVCVSLWFFVWGVVIIGDYVVRICDWCVVLMDG